MSARVGKITSQYLYLTEGTGGTARAIPVAKLESADNPDNATHSDRILYIHADQRGAPMQMTDESQKVVWQTDTNPWGAPIIRAAANDTKFANTATLNLRLPGQYFDAETGLHDNVYRTYNPNTGRYLQPDPLGYPDGPDPYLYASGDPVNKIDPLGLYQSDIHYYMTFFLALTAGIDYEQARITALAAQYVDNNPMTMPLDDHSMVSMLGSVFKNHQQLLLYHFVLSDSADLESASAGHTLAAYNNDNVNSVVGNYSPQMKSLVNAIIQGNPDQPDATYQFLGEFIHAFADTFSHRDRCNLPFDAFSDSGLGVGHGFSGSQPDYTYDDERNDDGTPKALGWYVREDRTFAAETAMFNVLKSYTTASGTDFSKIEQTLKDFNKIKESGDDVAGLTQKLTLLQETLKSLGIKDQDGKDIVFIFDGKAGKDAYIKSIATTNREVLLRDQEGNKLNEGDYPGVCLPEGERCKPLL